MESEPVGGLSEGLKPAYCYPLAPGDRPGHLSRMGPVEGGYVRVTSTLRSQGPSEGPGATTDLIFLADRSVDPPKRERFVVTGPFHKTRPAAQLWADRRTTAPRGVATACVAKIQPAAPTLALAGSAARRQTTGSLHIWSAVIRCPRPLSGWVRDRSALPTSANGCITRTPHCAVAGTLSLSQSLNTLVYLFLADFFVAFSSSFLRLSSSFCFALSSFLLS